VWSDGSAGAGRWTYLRVYEGKDIPSPLLVNIVRVPPEGEKEMAAMAASTEAIQRYVRVSDGWWVMRH